MPGGHLHQAVEAAPLAPRPVPPPRGELRDDQPGAAYGQRLRASARTGPGRRAGSPVTTTSALASSSSKVAPVARPVAQVERVDRFPIPVSLCGVLALRQLGSVDPQHVRAEQGEVRVATGPGEHPGEIEDPQPGGRQQRRRRSTPGGPRGGCSSPDPLDDVSSGCAAARGSLLVRRPLLGRTRRPRPARPPRTPSPRPPAARRPPIAAATASTPASAGQPERGQQPGPVVRVVGVRTAPSRRPPARSGTAERRSSAPRRRPAQAGR